MQFLRQTKTNTKKTEEEQQEEDREDKMKNNKGEDSHLANVAGDVLGGAVG